MLLKGMAASGRAAPSPPFGAAGKDALKPHGGGDLPAFAARRVTWGFMGPQRGGRAGPRLCRGAETAREMEAGEDEGKKFAESLEIQGVI